jgi:inner membrane protein
VPASRTAALLSLGVVAAADGVGLRRSRRRWVSGVIDESAHLATGLIVLRATRRSDAGFTTGLLGASFLIDVDHVPEAFGLGWLRRPGARPVTHSAVTIAALARAVPREAAAGVAVGLAAHLARDLSTGSTGVPLLWPLTKRPFTAPYALYAAALAALAFHEAAPPPPPPAAPNGAG